MGLRMQDLLTGYRVAFSGLLGRCEGRGSAAQGVAASSLTARVWRRVPTGVAGIGTSALGRLPRGDGAPWGERRPRRILSEVPFALLGKSVPRIAPQCLLRPRPGVWIRSGRRRANWRTPAVRRGRHRGYRSPTVRRRALVVAMSQGPSRPGCKPSGAAARPTFRGRYPPCSPTRRAPGRPGLRPASVWPSGWVTLPRSARASRSVPARALQCGVQRVPQATAHRRRHPF